MAFGYFGMYKTNWYCRWCGKHVEARISERDGFCRGGKCKQAWWRAFKKYEARVTKKQTGTKAIAGGSNAKKSHLPSKKKRKTRYGSKRNG